MDVFSEGDMSEVLLSQTAQKMELDVSQLDFLSDEEDDKTLSQICETMENEHKAVEGLTAMSLNTDRNFRSFGEILY